MLIRIKPYRREACGKSAGTHNTLFRRAPECTGARVLPVAVVPVHAQHQKAMFRLVPVAENRTLAPSVNGALVASGYRDRVKLQPCGPLKREFDFTLPTLLARQLKDNETYVLK